MRKSVYRVALASAIALANLIVFVHCLPMICEAWGSSSRFMFLLSTLLFVWVESLADPWSLGYGSLRIASHTITPDLPLGEPLAKRQGGDQHV
jgi:hypothetical protein